MTQPPKRQRAEPIQPVYSEYPKLMMVVSRWAQTGNQMVATTPHMAGETGGGRADHRNAESIGLEKTSMITQSNLQHDTECGISRKPSKPRGWSIHPSLAPQDNPHTIRSVKLGISLLQLVFPLEDGKEPVPTLIQWEIQQHWLQDFWCQSRRGVGMPELGEVGKDQQ